MLLIFLLCFYGTLGQYKRVEQWEGSTFFNNFDWFTGGDPTHGYVNFVNYDVAFAKGYAKNPAVPNPIYMGVDTTNVATGRGRDSIRLTSKQSWTVKPGSPTYVFAIDLAHMPTGCGTWPAWWFVGPNWPSGGEIDVIEGVNNGQYNAYTLHTTTGCSLQSGDSGSGNKTNHPSCASSGSNNQGCGITGPYGSYGELFNNQGGGVFALLWDHSRIAAYYFPRSRIPGDLSRASTSANPGSWGEPVAFWNLGSNCPYNHFHDIQMVFDLTFCGDWAGAVFNANCPNKGTCQHFVQNSPHEFSQAFWSVNFIKLFQN